MGKKRILVCVDVQNDFINGSLGSEDAVEVVPNIVKKVKEGNWDFIFLTRDTHDEDYLFTKEGENLRVVHCVSGTDGWKIEDSVMNAVKESGVPYAVHNKYTFGLESIAMDLEYELDKETDIDFTKDEVYVEFCGFCTDICVISNALILKASWFDFADIAVDPSCCAGSYKEGHYAALDVMKSCQIKTL